MSQDFISFARAHGVEINPSKLHPSEKIIRCGTVDKPKSTNGAFFRSGERGFVWNWAEEARAQWFEDPHARRWTEEEKKPGWPSAAPLVSIRRKPTPRPLQRPTPC